MRRMRTSSGWRHSCAEGAEFFCCPHHVIPTKSIIRVELEQHTYENINIVQLPCTECPERISGLQALLEGAPPLPERKLLWHSALEKEASGWYSRWSDSDPGRLRLGTKTYGRTAHSNGRAGKAERSNTGCGRVHRHGCE